MIEGRSALKTVIYCPKQETESGLLFNPILPLCIVHMRPRAHTKALPAGAAAILSARPLGKGSRVVSETPRCFWVPVWLGSSPSPLQPPLQLRLLLLLLLPRLLPCSCLGAFQTVIRKGEGERDEGKEGEGERGREFSLLPGGQSTSNDLELALVKLTAISSSVIKQIVVCQESRLVRGAPCVCLPHRLGVLWRGQEGRHGGQPAKPRHR